MYQKEIEHVMRNFYYFKGVFPIDKIPDFKNLEFAIINTSPSHKTYGHWICLGKNNIQTSKIGENPTYTSRHVYELFNSLGLNRDEVSQFCAHKKWEKNSIILYNETRLQTDDMRSF